MTTAPRWDQRWRQQTWSGLDRHWDLVVVGGGIVGAGILRLAASVGVRALLVEQGDFASGTSSRSSQLVHGGLRYLAQGQVGLTRSAVTERERLLRDAPGLVEPLDFLFPMYDGDRRKSLGYGAVLTAYDALARRHGRHGISAAELALLVPALHPLQLSSGLRYREAVTDDARLVLRVLRDAARHGGQVLNYAPALSLSRGKDGISGVRVRDALTGDEVDISATVVVNATGAWADALRAEVGGESRMRPLKGSHLVFASDRFPMSIGVNVPHPEDGRVISVAPWQGATVVGTTDLDHHEPLEREITVTDAEVDYLMRALDQPFRSLGLTRADIVSTWSGVRPTVSTGAANASRELRSHVVWDEDGLLTVTGGKLTTFRAIAKDAVAHAAARLPALAAARSVGPALDVPAKPAQLGREGGPVARIRGRHGAEARSVIAAAEASELEPLAGTPVTLAEIRWAARSEAVIHLDDLMLRRARLGLLVPDGGARFLPLVRMICQAELSWDDTRWAQEEAAYTALMARAHSLN